MSLSQQTKRESFALIQPQLMPKQQVVYDCILQHRSISNRMLSVRLNLAINSVTGRTNELVELGMVEEDGMFFDATTRRNVIQWRIKSQEQQLRIL